MGEQKPEKTKKHICAGLLAHVEAGNTRPFADVMADLRHRRERR